MQKNVTLIGLIVVIIICLAFMIYNLTPNETLVVKWVNKTDPRHCGQMMTTASEKGVQAMVVRMNASSSKFYHWYEHLPEK